MQSAPDQDAVASVVDAQKLIDLVARQFPEVKETLEALEASDWDRTKAAERLDISRAALYKRFAKYKRIIML